MYVHQVKFQIYTNIMYLSDIHKHRTFILLTGVNTLRTIRERNRRCLENVTHAFLQCRRRIWSECCTFKEVIYIFQETDHKFYVHYP